MDIFNFANRQLCEYQTIFPSVVSLLDHLLFTNGNGYEFDSKRGMIYGFEGNKKIYIDQYPEMNDTDWEALIIACHAKERKFHESYARASGIDLGELAEDCAKYKRVSVTASMFSEDELYQQLREMARAKQMEAFESGRYPSFVRPYPLSPGYAEIFKLNEKTPGWFLQIAFNLCRAWVKFLDGEIKYNSIWVKPSLRPAPTEKQIANAEAMAELFEMIKADDGYDGWLNKAQKEPESDYADLSWTTKHRDLLAQQTQRLGELLVSSSKFEVGDKVIVKIRDPFHTYAGCAEPMPGMKAVVSDLDIQESAAAGKIAVKFEPEVLGYGRKEDDGSDESITLYLRPWILEKQ
jgi:hypothetical protein